MLPWGHAAFGYLLYSLGVRARGIGPPGDTAVLALAVGTQVADVDKVLAWTFDVLPSGRSLAHSVFVAAVLVAVVHRLFLARDRRTESRAFALGYASHLVADSLGPLLRGEHESLGFLLWPVTPPLPDDNGSILAFFLTLELTPLLWFGLGVAGLALVVWTVDGTPGVAALRGAGSAALRGAAARLPVTGRR